MSIKADRRQVLGGAGVAGIALVLPTGVHASQAAHTSGRNQNFDLGWRFRRGAGDGFEGAAVDDSGWRAVDLPHDWSIEDLPGGDGTSIIGPFDKKSIGGTATGFSVGGDGWYRKHFRLEKTEGQRVEIHFEGVYRDSQVFINGQLLGTHVFGYTPFAYDLTPHLAADGDNVLAVKVRNGGQASRWYSGSGIYRHVWLDVMPAKARFARWGVGVFTKRIVAGGATVELTSRLEDVGEGLVLVSRIRDASGKTVWEGRAAAQAEVVQTALIKAPKLWSDKTPILYTLETELRRGAAVIDKETAPFGIRIVTFDAEHGMRINGVVTKLRGGCIHHDLGLLGAASFDEAEDRKVRILRARGYNAIRGSHNPYSTAFIRACDKHGMLLISEAFDAWFGKKLPQDYSTVFEEDWKADLTTIINSQRNHPCIVMWSIGNEIPERSTPHGVETQWKLANEIHKLDPTRPVTAAIHAFPGHPLSASEKTARPGRAGVAEESDYLFLDVGGYNYKLDRYEDDHKLYPKRIMYGSESFPKDVFAIWDLTDKTPYLIGDFVWTAMDYLGEAGIGGSTYGKAGDNPLAMFAGWPWMNSFCGDIDLIGQQKGPSFARDVAWNVSKLEIGVQKPAPEGKVENARQWGWVNELQSWSWAGHEGKPITVRVYTVGDKVELRLNGKLIQSKAVKAADLKQTAFTLPYAKGVLEVVAFRKGTEIARRKLETVGAAAAVKLTPERKLGGAGRGAVSYIAVEIVDAQGQRVPDVEKALKISISGPAELVGFGSANPFAVGSFQSSSAKTWDGRAQIIVRGTGKVGAAKIEARGEGLHGGVALLHLG